MKVSTITSYCAQLFGDQEALRILAAAGYDGVDYSMYAFSSDHFLYHCSDQEVIDYYTAVKKTGDEVGLSFFQFHSAFGPYPKTQERLEEYVDQSRRAILACQVLNCPYVVIHPLIPPYCLYDQGHEKAKEENMAFFTRLMPLLEQCHVQVGIENMFSRDPETGKICPTVVSRGEEMADYIDTLTRIAGKELFVACLDIGHGRLIQGESPERMIRILEGRLRLLHVQDSNGVQDLHTIPYLGGAVNWDKVCQALKEIGYSGVFNFEADTFISQLPRELLSQSAALQCALGRVLAGRAER